MAVHLSIGRDKRIIAVARPFVRLGQVLPRFAQLGLEVVEEDNLEVAYRRVMSARDATMVAIEERTSDPARRHFAERLHANARGVPLFWLSLADSLQDDVIARECERLVIARFVPAAVAEGLGRAALAVLSTTFACHAVAGPPRISQQPSALADTVAMVPFTGHGAAGVLALSASQEHLLHIYDRILPRPKMASTEIAKALASEMAQRMLTRFEEVLKPHGVSVRKGMPMAMHGRATRVTPSPGRVVWVQALTEPAGQMFVELGLDVFQPAGEQRE